MPSLRRPRPTAEPTAPAGPPAPTAAPKPGGKGRPTPKRSEAQRRRPPVAAPTNRKEKAARVRAEREQARAGLLRGEERYFGPRDRGPVRRLVRDVVDSRRNVGVLMLPLSLLIVLISFLGRPAVQSAVLSLWTAAIIVVVLDLAILSRLVVRRLRERFPDGHAERTRTLVIYAISRATVFRRLRTPPPAVKPGDRL